MTLHAEERRRPLNHPEACRRTRELWGESGSVEVRQNEAPERRYVVGTKGGAPGKTAFGRGATWEEAFANAERNGPK